MPEDEEEEVAREGRAPVLEPVAAKKPEERSKKQQCKSLAEPAGTGKGTRGCRGTLGGSGSGDGALCFADHGPPGKRLESKPRVPVRYCTLGTRDSAR